MTSNGDEDALSWDGDDALDARRPEMRPRERHSDDSARSTPQAGEGASVRDAAVLAPVEDADGAQGLSTVALVLLGILGGVYLLYTIGWVIGGVGMQTPVVFTLPTFLYQAALWLAVLAPAVWFVAVLVVTRAAKEWVRIVWLIAGAALLVPWPFVVFGGGGAL